MPTLKVPMEIVDTTTGIVVERKMADVGIVPPKDPNACQTCAVRHGPNEPHDALSLHYQYTFYAEHRRWPTWKDALAHCSEPVRSLWETELRTLGHWPETEEDSGA